MFFIGTDALGRPHHGFKYESRVILNMKKCLILIVSILILSSCVLLENDVNYSNPIENVNENQDAWAEIVRVLKPDQEVVYRNYIAGYQITFPESWLGWFVITEYSCGNIGVGFYGQSRMGRDIRKIVLGAPHYGIDFFFIVNEPHFEGSSFKIGEVNGVEFYHTHGSNNTEFLRDIAILDTPSRRRIDQGIKERGIEYIIDEREIALAAQDFEKMNEMWGDVFNILETFQAIE